MSDGATTNGDFGHRWHVSCAEELRRNGTMKPWRVAKRERGYVRRSPTTCGPRMRTSGRRRFRKSNNPAFGPRCWKTPCSSAVSQPIESTSSVMATLVWRDCTSLASRTRMRSMSRTISSAGWNPAARSSNRSVGVRTIRGTPKPSPYSISSRTSVVGGLQRSLRWLPVAPQAVLPVRTPSTVSGFGIRGCYCKRSRTADRNKVVIDLDVVDPWCVSTGFPGLRNGYSAG